MRGCNALRHKRDRENGIRWRGPLHLPQRLNSTTSHRSASSRRHITGPTLRSCSFPYPIPTEIRPCLSKSLRTLAPWPGIARAHWRKNETATLSTAPKWVHSRPAAVHRRLPPRHHRLLASRQSARRSDHGCRNRSSGGLAGPTGQAVALQNARTREPLPSLRHSRDAMARNSWDDGKLHCPGGARPYADRSYDAFADPHAIGSVGFRQRV